MKRSIQLSAGLVLAVMLAAPAVRAAEKKSEAERLASRKLEEERKLGFLLLTSSPESDSVLASIGSLCHGHGATHASTRSLTVAHVF